MTPHIRPEKSIATLWVTALAVALGLCWVATYCIIVPIGDDLGYANAFHRSVADADAPYRILHYLRRHYEATNGRFANILTYLSLGALPQWASAVMCGMMVPAYYLLTLYFCGVYPSRGKGLAATASAAFVAVCFCWYDYFTILCVNFNYVWGMALPMAVLWLMKRNVPLPRNAVAATIVFLLCIAAGAMHEAATLTLSVGLGWVCLAHGVFTRRGWDALGRSRAAYLTAFFIGTILVAFSPGIWARVGHTADLSPDAAPPVLVAVSAPLTIALILVFAAALFTPRGREKLRRMLWSEQAVWPIAAICALPIIVKGGIIGRSGFFSQTCALIALMQWFRPWRMVTVGRRTAAVVAVLTGAVALAQLVAVIPLQKKSADAYAEVIDRYRRSADGVVYYDMPADTTLPLWAASRVRNLVTDDIFTLAVLQQRYGLPHPLVLLPRAARAVDLSAITPGTVIRLSPTEWLSGTAPAGTLFPDTALWCRATGAGVCAGGSYSVTPVPHAAPNPVYYIARRGGHFGDRDRP